MDRQMEKSFVIFDIDGTLLDEEKRIPESTRRAVRLLQERGIGTAIATGRAPTQFEWIRRELNIRSYVAMNGQFTVWEGRTVYANRIDPELLGRMTDMAAERGDAIGYCGEKELAASAEAHPLIMMTLGRLKLDHPPVNPQFFRHTPVYQGYLFCKTDTGRHYKEAFPDLHFIQWHPNAYDILPLGVSKAVGIAKLLEAAGVPNSRCYAFGDGINDVEMLTEVGTGIAMGNAVPEAKAAADYVTTSNEQDGIWNGLVAVGLLD
ncbi:Cof-type HAD-IIB family hydrolase [Paenibacillus thermoaerophilus]|uniref:Cof-type HAD-IIB family hydrolase n=1 Tax=Paenibacillus thermoaerophilus TaxID=1215385 RepID=A0ABW2V4N9_9BACL|nr:Cof-type HAD-IIB family hydrolase [Paenibacillus thermoaerophilus]